MSFITKAYARGGSLLRWLYRDWLLPRPNPAAPVDVIFCVVDHYEPVSKRGMEQSRKNNNRLLEDYPLLAAKHRDHDNRIPRRTWFFPPHSHKYGLLRDLVSICDQGYGEIELHLHHGKTAPDNEANLRQTIEQTIREYSEFGIFGSTNGRKRYGFIHGDWALANSRNGRFCGVNSEITVLKETGCYADFTFPCANEASPRKLNSIYYATDDHLRPKSHDTGRNVEKGAVPSGDLIIVEGPTHPYFVENVWRGLRVLGDNIDLETKPDPGRIDLWVRTAVHVAKQRNWVFVKVHTHGAEDAPVVSGQPMDEAFSYLEKKYNDGTRYRLHYVTARELYNIVKAAEAGEPGQNPAAYRDYCIQPPTYDASFNRAEASARLQALVAKTYRD
jgi:hypothetical protein